MSARRKYIMPSGCTPIATAPVYKKESCVPRELCAATVKALSGGKAGKFERSRMQQLDGTVYACEDRRNSSTLFLRDASCVPELIECRDAMRSVFPGMANDAYESLQITRYDEGGHYDAHYDSSAGFARHATILLYLNDDFDGGETEFTELGVRIVPRQGMVVVFTPSALDGTLRKDMLHKACAVTKGTKWILQQWVRLKA